MNIKNEKGLTLVEVLAVVSLSMIVMIAAYQAFYFVTGAIETSSTKTELRKEANILLLSLENHLLNVDTIEIQGSEQPFTAFTGFTNRLDEMKDDTTFTYIEESIEFSIQDGNLMIDHIQQNADDMDLSNTIFEFEGGNLRVHLNIIKNHTDKKYSIVKIFKLGTDS